MSKIITLKTSDDVDVQVEENIVKLFTTMTNLLSDIVNSGGGDTHIPLPEVTSPILKIAIDYGRLYNEKGGVKPLSEEERQDEKRYLNVNEWEKAFFAKLETSVLFELILAANYLENKHLLEGACKVVAADMLTKSDDDVRKMWGIINDFTPEEQALYDEEKKWCAE